MGFFHLRICISGCCVCGHDSVAHFFLAMQNIPLSSWATFIYPLTYWKTSWLFPKFDICEEGCSKHPHAASFAHFKVAFFLKKSCGCFYTFAIQVPHQRCELQTFAPMLCVVFPLSRWHLLRQKSFSFWSPVHLFLLLLAPLVSQ